MLGFPLMTYVYCHAVAYVCVSGMRADVHYVQRGWAFGGYQGDGRHGEAVGHQEAGRWCCQDLHWCSNSPSECLVRQKSTSVMSCLSLRFVRVFNCDKDPPIIGMRTWLRGVVRGLCWHLSERHVRGSGGCWSRSLRGIHRPVGVGSDCVWLRCVTYPCLCLPLKTWCSPSFRCFAPFRILSLCRCRHSIVLPVVTGDGQYLFQPRWARAGVWHQCQSQGERHRSTQVFRCIQRRDVTRVR